MSEQTLETFELDDLAGLEDVAEQAVVPTSGMVEETIVARVSVPVPISA